MRITDFAKALGVSPDTIRRLERRGLIHPARDWAGQRRFTTDDLTKVRDLLFRNKRVEAAR
jgi:DNA-binding transcriptional MerR regulator